MDSLGRMVDEKGNIINIKRDKELKINENTQKEAKNKDLQKIIKEAKTNLSQNAGVKRKFHDTELDNYQGPNAPAKREKRKKMAFSFVEEGTFVKRGEIMRRKQVASELESTDPISSLGDQLQSEGSK